MSVSKLLFYLAVLSFVIGLILKLAGAEFPHLFRPYTYLKGTWSLLLFSISYHLIFEKGK